MKITPGLVILVTLLIAFHFSTWVMAENEKEVEEISDNDTSSSLTATEITHQHQLLLESKLDGKLDNNIEGSLTNITNTTTEENIETTTKLPSSAGNSSAVEVVSVLQDESNVENAVINESDTSTTTTESFPDTTVEITEEMFLVSSTSPSFDSTSQEPMEETSPDSLNTTESEESRSPASLVSSKHPIKPNTSSERTVSDQTVSASEISNSTVSTTLESTANISSQVPTSSNFPTASLNSNNSVLLESNKENASNLENGLKKNHTLGIMDILKPPLGTQDVPIIIKPNETTTVEPALIPVPQTNRRKHKFRTSCHNCGRDFLPQLRGAPLTFLHPPLPLDSRNNDEEQEIRFIPVEADVNLDRSELLKRRIRFQRVKDFMRSISSAKSPQEFLADKRAIIPSLKMHRNTGSPALSPPSDKTPSESSCWNPFNWFLRKKSQAQSRSESFIQTATSFVVDKLTQKFARLTGSEITI